MLNSGIYDFHRKRQRGAVLIVGLIILILLTMLALTALQGTVLQERMSSNFYDSDKAFNAGTASARNAEDITVFQYMERSNVNAYSTSDASTTKRMPFKLADETSWAADKSGELANFGGAAEFKVGKDPRYMIDYWFPLPIGPSLEGGIPRDIEVFRVTARGYGGDTRSQNVTQSTVFRLVSSPGLGITNP